MCSGRVEFPGHAQREPIKLARHPYRGETLPYELHETFTETNFDEASYLAAHADVRAAVSAGRFSSGRHHFDLFGRSEGRTFDRDMSLVEPRRTKMAKLEPFLRTDMACAWEGGKVNFLTPELRESARICDTDAQSQHAYDGDICALIRDYPDGLILDCGAGLRKTYFENVVNFEIVDYPSTDVLGVGETLPFVDGTFDAVISVAVLEHVRDPFRCADEIARVLKPGGRLYCCVPFLQPYHGYPHHYFNATPQGLRRLFADTLHVDDVRTNEGTHPIWALQWILASWADGLPPETCEAFRKMTVEDLLRAPGDQIGKPFCRDLPPNKTMELACATILTARKEG